MEGWTFALCACLCVSLFAHLSHGGGSSSPVKEKLPPNSGDVIMKEDAEEVFYNVDLEKYDDLGIRCPEPEPPVHGAITGSGVRVGSVVYVVCREGYRLLGPTVMACVPYGDGAQWDPVMRRECVAGSGDFDESKPSVKIPDQGQSLKELPPSSLVKYDDPPFLHPRIRANWRKGRKYEASNTENDELDEEEETDLQPRGIPSFCLEKPVAGPCRASFKRFYYDKTTYECRLFIYGGCNGNKNNFESLDDCHLTCMVNI